jgi:hypothetical protein
MKFLSTSLLLLSMFAAVQVQAEMQTTAPGAAEIHRLSQDEGIRFSCKAAQLAKVKAAMDAYLASLEIAPDLVVKKMQLDKGRLLYTLNTPPDDTNTLDFSKRPEFKLAEELVNLPQQDGSNKIIYTVSKKEIVLALLQHGRLTQFRDKACDIAALQDNVAIRQNTVAWAQHLTWVWPDGERAEWNEKYWHRGTPKPGVALSVALNDVFMNQDKYAIGCYTATKLVVVQGILDYYSRIKKSPSQLKLVEDRLMHDQDPLVGIEPARAWDFEKDFDPHDLDHPGKLLKVKEGVRPMNFVPGDWAYFLNTDPVSYEKTGYEGSNAIYLGRNKFDDYYDDNNHSYSYYQKLDEVYQWRNGVFSRSRDFAKIKPLSPQDVARLSKRPAEGGLLKSIRITPYQFAYEELPQLAGH